MKTAVIRQRVADFLQRYTPFDALTTEDLLAAAGSGRVAFHESGEYIHRGGAAPGPWLWMVQQGRVDIVESTAFGEELRDVLGEGDLIGVERFTNEREWRHAARTATDVILYGIPADLFASLAARCPAVQRFVSAHVTAGAGAASGRTSWLDEEAPPAGFLKARLVTLPDGTPPQDAERSLPNARNGAVALTDRGGRCRGVLTAAGLREPCPAIASPLTVRAALRAFLDDGGDALAIAAGGSEGPLEALLTARDLALFTGHDIPGLIRALEGARSQVELEPLLTPGRKAVLAALAQPHDVDDCLRAASAINLAAARAALRVDAGNTHSAGGRRCCWLLTGDAARGDSLLVAAPPLTQLADDASAFEEHCLEAIRDPLAGGLYERRAALDFQFVEGDAGRYEQFQEAIGAALRAHPETVSLLANDTLSQLPPLTFFRDLVLHLDGAQQETLDLDAAALHPIADAARVFALAQGRLGLPRTIDRLEAAARDYPSAEAVLRQAAAAFRTAVFHRTVNGGPLVHPGALRKLDQRLLKTAFSSVQSLLELTSATFFWSAA